MTNKRLEELNNLKQQIADLKEHIDSMGLNYDYFELNGRYKGDANVDFILSFLKEKLAKLEKEFEEA